MRYPPMPGSAAKDVKDPAPAQAAFADSIAVWNEAFSGPTPSLAAALTAVIALETLVCPTTGYSQASWIAPRRASYEASSSSPALCWNSVRTSMPSRVLNSPHSQDALGSPSASGFGAWAVVGEGAGADCVVASAGVLLAHPAAVMTVAARTQGINRSLLRRLVDIMPRTVQHEATRRAHRSTNVI